MQPTMRLGALTLLTAMALCAAGASTPQLVSQASADPASSTTLRLTAMATLLDGVGAEVSVRINGKDAGHLTVTSQGWSDYDVPLDTPLAAGDRIDIRFENDAWNTTMDRNLLVQKIESAGVTKLPTGGTTTYDRGSDWTSATDARETLPGQMILWWNGALRFDWPTGAAAPLPAPVPAPPSPSPNTAFSASSFWYQKIPTNAPLHPNSADFAQNLVNDTRNNVATVNTVAYAPPIYEVGPDAPRVKIQYENCTGAKNDDTWLEKHWTEMFASVPMPSKPIPAAGEDAEIVISSPSTNEVWEMWRFHQTPTGYAACWGGKIKDTNMSDGVFPYPFGVTAGGLSLLGGTIRVSELRAGRIDHAIAIGINRPRKGVHSWPANRDDGTWDDARAIPEGARLRLNPNVDVDSLSISPIAKIIAKAGQQYGFVVRDNTAGPLVIYAEDSAPFVREGMGNPYSEMFGSEYWHWMEDFPWDQIQGLPLDYGKP